MSSRNGRIWHLLVPHDLTHVWVHHPASPCLNRIRMPHSGCPSPAPPLCSSPTSRLYTSTTEWYKNVPSLRAFLEEHMPFLPLHMLPSFTGMGLVTDIDSDSQSSAPTEPPLLSLDGSDLRERVSERVLTWRRVTSWTDEDAAEGQSESNGPRDQTWGSESCGRQTPLTLVVSNDESGEWKVRQRRRGTSDLPPCGLWGVLHEAFWHCLCCMAFSVESSSHRNHHTPLTWCLLVCHLSAQLDPESLSTLRWQDLADQRCISKNLVTPNKKKQRVEHWLGLRAMIQYLLTTLPYLHTPNLLWLFHCEGGQEGVVRYCHTFQKDMSAKWQALPLHSQVRLLLVLPATVPATSPWAETDSSPGPLTRVQIIDNVRLLNNKTQITFCLPKRHSLSQLGVQVCLWLGQDEGFRAENYFGLLHDMAEVPIPPSPSLRVQNRLTIRGAISAVSVPGSARGVGGVLQLLALCEFEERYEATVKVPPQREEMVDVRWPSGVAATWQVEITMERSGIECKQGHRLVVW